MTTVFSARYPWAKTRCFNLELKTGIRLPTGQFINAETDSAGYARIFISGRLESYGPVETIVGTFSYDAVLSDDDYTFTLTTDIYDEVLNEKVGFNTSHASFNASGVRSYNHRETTRRRDFI